MSLRPITDDTVHGIAATYRTRGCRCRPCTDAATRQVKLYRLRTKADGRGRPTVRLRVEVAPVRAHVDELRASGWTLRAIAAELDLSIECLWDKLNRRREIDKNVAGRILALEPFTGVLLDEVVVDRLVAGGDWRQLNANRAERIAAFQRIAHRQGDEGTERARGRLGLNTNDARAALAAVPA